MGREGASEKGRELEEGRCPVPASKGVLLTPEEGKEEEGNGREELGKEASIGPCIKSVNSSSSSAKAGEGECGGTEE